MVAQGDEPKHKWSARKRPSRADRRQEQYPPIPAADAGWDDPETANGIPFPTGDGETFGGPAGTNDIDQPGDAEHLDSVLRATAVSGRADGHTDEFSPIAATPLSPRAPDVRRPRGGTWRRLEHEGIVWEGQVILMGAEVDLAARLIVTSLRAAFVRSRRSPSISSGSFFAPRP